MIAGNPWHFGTLSIKSLLKFSAYLSLLLKIEISIENFSIFVKFNRFKLLKAVPYEI